MLLHVTEKRKHKAVDIYREEGNDAWILRMRKLKNPCSTKAGSIPCLLTTACLLSAPLSLVGDRLSVNVYWISRCLFVEQIEECLEGGNLFGQR